MLLLQTVQTAPSSPGVGLEWMPLASLLIPILLLIAIWFFGSRNAV